MYSARSPSSANALDEKAMSGSEVTPKTAGMESTAKRTSLSSTQTRASSSGVARDSPEADEKKRSPSYLGGGDG